MLLLTATHCKKSWRSSSTPASGDAGPKHTGVEQSFRHPWRKFYYKYRTFPTFFTSVELVRQTRKASKAACAARTYDLQDYNLPLYHCATLSSLCKSALKDTKDAAELHLYSLLFTLYSLLFTLYLYLYLYLYNFFLDCFGDTKDAAELHLYSLLFTL